MTDERFFRPRPKIVHMAKMIRDDGQVSPRCAEKPHPINLRIATWTLRAEAVTCPRCRKRLQPEGKP